MYRVQRFQTTVTIPVNNDTQDAPLLGANGRNSQLNGILKGITIDAPALTGTAYTLWLLGQRGEVLFTKSGNVESQLTYIDKDSNNRPLEIPVSLQGVAPFRIKSTGTPDATGVLTFSNNGAIADGDTVTIGDQVYRFKETLAAANDVLIEPDVAASAVLTSDNTNPDDGDQVVVNDKTYTFKTALTPTAGEILIGADANETLANLRAAVNGLAGEGTTYATGTEQPTDVTAGAVDTDNHTLTFTADTPGTGGNSYPKSETSAHLDYDGAGANFTGGAWSGDATLGNLADAINLEDGGGESGTKYHEDTLENAYVSAGAVTSHAITVTAKDEVDDPADVDTLESSARLSWGAETLEGGGEEVERTFNIDLLIDRG